jgi:DNA topoisomerase-1
VLNTLADPKTGKSIQVCEGKWGPYITDGEINARAPQGVEPMAITLEQARAAIAEAAQKQGKGGRKAPKAKAAAKPKAAPKAKAAAKPKSSASKTSRARTTPATG